MHPNIENTLFMNITRPILIFIFFCCTYALQASGQNAKADSLETALKRYSKIDTTRVDLMNNLAYELYTSAPNKAKEYADEALKMGFSLKYHKGEATSLWITGLTLLRNDREKALDYFRNALKIAEAIDDKVGICNYQTAIGNITKSMGNIKESIEAHEKSLQIALELNNKELILKSRINLSREMSRRGDHVKAAQQLQEVIKVAGEIGNELLLARAYTNLAFIYNYQGDLTTALNYFLAALNLNEKRNDYKGTFLALINIAGIQSAQNDFQAAFGTISQALVSAREQGDSVQVSICFTTLGNIYRERDDRKALTYFLKAQTLVKDCEQTINNLTNIGAIYTKQGNFENAMKTFNEALSVAKKAESGRFLSEVYIKIGDLYFKQKKYNQAISYTQKALELTNQVAYAELQKDANKQLADIYYATGRYKEAYLHHVCYQVLEDSIFSGKNIRKIALLESSYQFAKEKDAYEFEKSHHQLKIKNQRLTIYSLIIISCLVLLLAVSIYWWNQLKKRVLQLEIEKMNQELEDNKKIMTVSKLKLIQNSERDAHNVKKLVDIEKITTGEEQKSVRSLINDYKSQNSYSNWEEFETWFTKVNTSFLDRLNELFPNLTLNERKLCMFLKLNMSNKDIAQITLQSEEALKKSRLRLRKKLGLTDRKINLVAFIQSL